MKLFKSLLLIQLFIVVYALTTNLHFLNKVDLSLIPWINNFRDSSQIQAKKNLNTRNIQDITFKQNQILQEKYLMAMNKTGMFPDDLEEQEKREFIDEALHDLYDAADSEDRELALLTLSEFEGREATEAMLFALNDPDDLVREEAIIQISEWKNDKERSQLLLNVLKDNNTDTLLLVLESISELHDKSLATRIKELLNHPNEEVREAAQLALELQD